MKGFPNTAGEKLLETVPKWEAGILTYGKGCAPSVPLGLIHEVPPNRGKSRAVSAAGLGLGCGDGAGLAEMGEVPECSPWDHRAGQLLLSRYITELGTPRGVASTVPCIQSCCWLWL